LPEGRGGLAAVFASAVIFFAGATLAHADADHAAIARAALSEVIRPGYAALAGEAASLTDKVGTLCLAPSASSLDASRAAFAATVSAWSKVEILRFGPIDGDHRYERLFYWPDPKGLADRQIKETLARHDETVTRAGGLPGKSVALQGLPALEYLLYGDGAETLAAPQGEGAFRCAFAHAVAANIAGIANSVVEAWREGSPYAKAFLNPGPDASVYRAPKEVTLDLFKSFVAGIELVRDQKLGKPLGATPEEARPRLAAFWRSGLSLANAAGNLDGVRALFAKGGFAQVVADDSAGVEKSVEFDLDHAIEVLSGIAKPMAEVVKDTASRDKIGALRVSLKSAGQTAADAISRGAGLTFGFNAMDGD
jgi:predicted lipoprotein